MAKLSLFFFAAEGISLKCRGDFHISLYTCKRLHYIVAFFHYIRRTTNDIKHYICKKYQTSLKA